MLKIISKGQKYNEAAVKLRLATLSFSSYDHFIPNSRQMDLAAYAFEGEMLVAKAVLSDIRLAKWRKK